MPRVNENLVKQQTPAITVAAAIMVFVAVLAGCGDKAKQRQQAQSVKEVCSEFFLKADYPSALTRCLEAERVGPDDPDTQILLGLIYRGMRNYPESISRLNKAIKIKGDLPEAYTNLGIVYSEVGRNQEAIEAFDKALSFAFYTKPDVVHINKCEVHLRTKNHRAALDACRAATQSNRASWEGHMKTGDVLVAMDRIPEAIEAYESAIRHGPRFPQPYFQLANLYIGRKDFPKACDNLFKVKEIAPDSEIGDRTLRLLKQIECKEPPKAEQKLPPAMNLDYLDERPARRGK